MHELSKRMRTAGWVIQPTGPGTWQAVSPENRVFNWENQTWSPAETELCKHLKETETAIAENRYSVFAGSSRLIHSGNLLTQWLIQHRQVHETSVLRVRVSPDPDGDEALYAAGARRVETLLQPWPDAPESIRHLRSHLLICEHVADALPKEERQKMLRRLITHLHPEAQAFFSFYQMESLPQELEHRSAGDGYVFFQRGHEVFLKPSLPGQCAPALIKSLGGFAEEVELLYGEIFCRWVPYA